MAKNDFKAFATDRNANVMSQEEWEALPALLSGFTAGKASSAQVNKVIRQASFIAAALAQFVSDKTQRDVLDNGDLPGFVELLGSGFAVEYLSRKNPFGDIKSDGTVKTALENLGLGDESGYVGRLLNVRVFYSSGIYNPTPGTKKVIVEMVGGGGGGAGARAAGPGQVAVGGAGGAGSYAKGQFTSGFSGVQVTVGSKGLGGTVSDVYPSVGGTSSFGSLMTAPGGDTGSPAGPTNNFPFSTVAAVVSGGATGANIIGTPGEGASSSIVISSSIIVDAPGGSSRFGAGGYITANNAHGINGSGYGSGGGPSSVTAGNAAVAGGDGAPGLVIIWEYA
ncbi:TPA: hypothetical protein LTC10_000115 [Escherichia coli]|nr:hypothetical protein [Escherichia coli]